MSAHYKLRHTSAIWTQASLSLIHYVQLEKLHSAVPLGTVQNRKTDCHPGLEASPLFLKGTGASLSLGDPANTGYGLAAVTRVRPGSSLQGPVSYYTVLYFTVLYCLLADLTHTYCTASTTNQNTIVS